MRQRVVTVGVFLSFALALPSCKRQESETSSPVDCNGMCGKYTRCDEGRCVVDYSTAVCEGLSTRIDEQPMEGPPPVTSWGTCDIDPANLPETFVPVDDSSIPSYDPNKATVLDMNAGSERLSEERLMVEMRTIEHELNKCLGIASCYNNGLGSGRIDFEFRVLGKSGQVDGVNVTAPEELSIYGIVPCTRAAIHDHRFPTFDGQQMVVNYSVELD